MVIWVTQLGGGCPEQPSWPHPANLARPTSPGRPHSADLTRPTSPGRPHPADLTGQPLPVRVVLDDSYQAGLARRPSPNRVIPGNPHMARSSWTTPTLPNRPDNPHPAGLSGRPPPSRVGQMTLTRPGWRTTLTRLGCPRRPHPAGLSWMTSSMQRHPDDRILTDFALAGWCFFIHAMHFSVSLQALTQNLSVVLQTYWTVFSSVNLESSNLFCSRSPIGQ